MHLSVDGQTFRIGQLGPDFIILNDHVKLPPGQGEITVSIDGHVERWRVDLPEGVSGAERACRIERCSS